MKRYYLTILLFLFTSLPFAQAQNVCIEPMDEDTFNRWLPMVGGIRSAMGYCGTPDIESLRRDVQLVRMSSNGYRESHPHDIDITEEAPNYTVANLNT